MKTSIFEIFKIGIGPSSSHTVGPMRARCDFIASLDTKGLLPSIRRIQVEPYGSLAPNACPIAMREGGEHKVSLDDVIKTMYETGKDMQSPYKETSLGGLATLNILEC